MEYKLQLNKLRGLSVLYCANKCTVDTNEWTLWSLFILDTVSYEPLLEMHR